MLGDELFSRKWCELLFENRNKEYGAYRLRANTGRRFAWAMGLVLVPVLLVTIPLIIYLWTQPVTNVKKIDPMERITRFEGVKIKEARPIRRPEQIKPEMTEQKKMCLTLIRLLICRKIPCKLSSRSEVWNWPSRLSRRKA